MNRLRIILATIFVVPMLIGMPAIASAQLTPASTGLDAAAQGSGLQGDCTGSSCLARVVGQVINIVLGFLGIVLLALLIYAGFLWMTAGGDTDKVQRARSTIVNAIAGLIVIAVSYSVAAFVLTQLGSITGGGGGDTGTDTGSSGSDAGSGVGRSCSAASPCPTITCPDGRVYTGLCVAGACDEPTCD